MKGGSKTRLTKPFFGLLSSYIRSIYLFEKANNVAVATERNRLARELYDAVTQTLFSASPIADVLPRIWERDIEEERTRLEELPELTCSASRTAPDNADGAVYT